MAQQSKWDISVEDLHALIREEVTFRLIDVREPHEHAVSDIGGELIPLATLPERIPNLDPDAHIVVHCKAGGRSAKAVNLLRAHGFTNVWNVQGGLMVWIERIDPDLSLG